MPTSPGTNVDALEVEWQFEAPDLAQVEHWLRAQPAHATLHFVDRGERVQVDRYLDTDDWRVYRAGYALRVRRAEDGAEATLKAFASAAAGDAEPARRREINEPLADGDSDPLSAPGPVGERLRLLGAGGALRTLFDVTTRRHGFRVMREGTELAAIALDEARIGEDAPGAPVLRRVEVEESAPGGLAAIESFVDALRAACALEPAVASKFASGLHAVGLEPGRAVDLGDPVGDPDGPVADFALAALRRAFAALLEREPGTRLGEDIEELHQMRVATRRLRAAGSVFAPVLPPEMPALREELRWIAGALGAVRDLDVQLEELAALQSAAEWDEGTALGPLITIVRAAHADARRALIAALDGDRYRRLVAAMTELLRRGVAAPQAGAPGLADPATAGLAHQTVAVYAAPTLRRRYRRYRRDAGRLAPDSPAVEYHAVRVRAKRFRYALEQFAGLYGRDSARMVARVKVVQDLLGEHQDSDVAIDWLRRLSREHGTELPPETLLAMGELMERHRARMVRLRGEWPRAFQGMRRAWKPLRRQIARRATPPDLETDEGDAPSPPEVWAAAPPPPPRVPSAPSAPSAGRAARPAAPANVRRAPAPPPPAPRSAQPGAPPNPRAAGESAPARGVSRRAYARLRAGVDAWRAADPRRLFGRGRGGGARRD